MKERNLVPAGIVQDQRWAVRYLDLSRGLRPLAGSQLVRCEVQVRDCENRQDAGSGAVISQQDQRAIAQAHAGDIGVQGLEAPDQLAAKRIAIETQVSVDVGRADMGSRY